MQASESITGSIPLHVPTEDDQSSAEDSESETNDDLLAKLSQSMFAALRPKAGSMDAGYRAVESSTAERDSLRAFQPDVVQPDRQPATQGSLHCLNDPLLLLAELHPDLCGFNPSECSSPAVIRLNTATNGAWHGPHTALISWLIYSAQVKSAQDFRSHLHTKDTLSTNGSLPLVAQITHCRVLPTDEHEEEEMHWQPLTGLPEPLTVTDCRSQAAATRTSQLEKQVLCSLFIYDA